MSRFPVLLGATDETYGVCLWVARVENLKAHLSIISDHLRDDQHWLRNQVRYAMAQADGYIADAVPSDDALETTIDQAELARNLG